MKKNELTPDEVQANLKAANNIIQTLVRVYRERGVWAASPEIHEHVDEDQARWCLLATVMGLADAQEEIEKLGFDQDHFGADGPTLH